MMMLCNATTFMVKLFPFLLPLTCYVAEAAATQHRVVVYYQTTNTNGTAQDHVSLLPLINSAPNISVTHVLVAAIHLDDKDGVHLNDYPPSNPLFDKVWSDVAQLQAHGVVVSGMLGGAAQGSFKRLDGDAASFEKAYKPLHDMIGNYNLQGLDLDVEENFSLSGCVRLIDRLRKDFGAGFVITLSPVASALQKGGGNLSGFSYFDLQAQRGAEVAFYNAQFYSGFGSSASTSDYQDIIDSGFAADKVVLGLLTNAANGGGFVALDKTAATVKSLIAEYPNFGGLAGWEYFNSQPGGASAPYKWAAWAAQAQATAAKKVSKNASTKILRASHDVWHVVRRWGRQTWRLIK